MAYMCVLAPSRECDGCEECKEYIPDEEYRRRWEKAEADYDSYRDEMFIREMEAQDGNI